MNLSQVDLNLLVVLHAVLEQQSVVAAAASLHVTPSAVSNALARLRQVLGDPLFVRRGRGLVPTPHALSLAPQLTQALQALSRVVGEQERFDPRTSTRKLSIAMADGDQLASLPALAKLFLHELPRAELHVLSVDTLISGGGLATPLADVALGPQFAEPELHWQLLYEESPVVLARRDHPALPARKEISRELFNTLRHVDTHVALGRPGTGHRAAGDAFSRAGLHRDIALVVPTFTAAAMVAANTDLLAALPRRVAATFGAQLPVRLLEFPGPVPTMPMGLLWHERTHHDVGARFFRALIARALGTPGKRARKPKG